jgi:hypothetical protein
MLSPVTSQDDLDALQLDIQGTALIEQKTILMKRENILMKERADVTRETEKRKTFAAQEKSTQVRCVCRCIL